MGLSEGEVSLSCLVGFRGISGKQKLRIDSPLLCTSHYNNSPSILACFGKYNCSYRALNLLEDPQVGWLLCIALTQGLRASLQVSVSFYSGELVIDVEASL